MKKFFLFTPGCRPHDNGCDMQKFFVIASRGRLNEIRRLGYNAKNFLGVIKISKPQIPVSVNYGTIFHLAAGIGDERLIKFLWSEVQRLAYDLPSESDNLFPDITKERLYNCINITDDDGNTPLMVAVKYEKVAAVKVFIMLGAKIDCLYNDHSYDRFRSGSNRCPLYIAMVYKSKNMFDTLLQLGVDSNQKNGKHHSLLHTALGVISLNKDEVSTSKYYGCIDSLLFFDVDPGLSSGESVKVARLCDPLISYNKYIPRRLQVISPDSSGSDYARRCIEKFNLYVTEFSYNNAITLPINTYEDYGSYIGMRVSAIDFAEILELDAISNKMRTYVACRKSGLYLLALSRTLLANNNPLLWLSKDVVIIILLLASCADNNLMKEQTTSVLNFAMDKSTLGTSKLEFLQENLYRFFLDKKLTYYESRLPNQQQSLSMQTKSVADKSLTFGFDV